MEFVHWKRLYNQVCDWGLFTVTSGVYFSGFNFQGDYILENDNIVNKVSQKENYQQLKYSKLYITTLAES